MRGSSPARITIWCLRLMDRTPASQAGNMGSTPVGITKVFKWNCSSRVECGPGKPRDAGSSPASSTIQKKSELIPNRERVRISRFYQRYYILSLCPPVLPAAESGALYIRRNIPPSVTAILSSGPSLRELFHLDQVIRSGSVAQCGGSLDGVDAVPAFNSFQ